MLEEILKQLGGITIGVAAVGFLIRSLVVHFLSKDVEGYKIKLAAENEAAGAKLQADLQREAKEHEITFIRIDQEVAKRLEKSYRLLHKVYEQASKYVAIIEWSGGPTKEERFELCRKYHQEFSLYFYANRCHIPPSLYLHIKKISDNLAEIIGHFTRGLQYEKDGRRPMRGDDDFWLKSIKRMDEEITPLFSVMVKAVQARLGVKDTKLELDELAKIPQPKKLEPPPATEASEPEPEDDDDEIAEQFDEEIEKAIHRPKPDKS